MTSFPLKCTDCAYRMYAYKKIKTEEWKSIPHENVSMHLQFGQTFGMLWIDITCPCGATEDFVYFFNLESDKFVSYMMPEVYEKCIFIQLPNKFWGAFSKMEDIWGFDDKYILDCFVHTYASTSIETSDMMVRNMNSFMDTMSFKIRMRTMFKKWYFREYRKAFAPGKNGFKRACLEYATL